MVRWNPPNNILKKSHFGLGLSLSFPSINEGWGSEYVHMYPITFINTYMFSGPDLKY